MLVYALAVIAALVTLTLLLVAGFERYEDRLGRYATYFPVLSGVVLILMGLGFVLGVI
jgi:cytochrome c biogenesis protein CcdA